MHPLVHLRTHASFASTLSWLARRKGASVESLWCPLFLLLVSMGEVPSRLHFVARGFFPKETPPYTLRLVFSCAPLSAPMYLCMVREISLFRLDILRCRGRFSIPALKIDLLPG